MCFGNVLDEHQARIEPRTRAQPTFVHHNGDIVVGMNLHIQRARVLASPFRVLVVGRRLSRGILANHARALGIELPSWQEKLHRTRIIARTQPHFIVERMCAFHLLQIDFHSEPWTLWNLNPAIFNPKWLSCKPLSILPNPVGIDSRYSSRRRRRHMRKHRERNIEVVVRVRPPGQSPLVTELRDTHRSLHRPEMRIGKRNVDCLQLNCMLQFTPVGSDHVSGRRQAP